MRCSLKLRTGDRFTDNLETKRENSVRPLHCGCYAAISHYANTIPDKLRLCTVCQRCSCKTLQTLKVLASSSLSGFVHLGDRRDSIDSLAVCDAAITASIVNHQDYLSFKNCDRTQNSYGCQALNSF
jgi:hypothetical protein